MHVAEKMSFDDYWNDPRFQNRKPEARGSLKYRYGDNVYHHSAAGEWQQSYCRHSLGSGAPNLEHIRRDTRYDAVLIGSDFTYWGAEGPGIPAVFRDWDGVDLAKPGRDYSSLVYPEEMVAAVSDWIATIPGGYQRPPADWP